jgi:hypothetical protein
MPAVQRPRPSRAPTRPLGAAAAGSEVSLRGLPQDRDVQRLIRDPLLQPGVLPLEFLQPAGLVDAQPAVLAPPSNGMDCPLRRGEKRT